MVGWFNAFLLSLIFKYQEKKTDRQTESVCVKILSSSSSSSSSMCHSQEVVVVVVVQVADSSDRICHCVMFM